MMNKALEVIEARWLFDLQPDQIKVVVHPQSIIHSMVVCRDHSVLAQMGTPDMRVPIAYGLSWPDRIQSGASQLDFTALSALTFQPADAERWPGLQLAWQCLKAAEGTTCVLNAANEVAVDAFLNRRIRFDQIHAVNLSTLEACPAQSDQVRSLEGLIGLDARARQLAGDQVKRFAP
jgi:1-deoxy-D-xylulose-5-phosphate reductoisomerase